MKSTQIVVRRLSFILLIMILMASCSIFKKSSKKKVKDNKQIEIVKQQDKKENTQSSVTKPVKYKPYNTCSFKVKTTFMGMPVSLSVRTAYDSIFWFSASSMGFEAMRVLATRDSIFIIDKINKENVHWNYVRASIYAGLPLTFDFIQDLFTDTTIVKSYSTPSFNGTILKKLNKFDGVTLAEEINIDGKIKNKQQKIRLIIKDYKINQKNDYPFDFIDKYKLVK